MVQATPKPFFPLLCYQKAAVESEARFRWSCWSRQTGKSFTMSLRRILRGLRRSRNQIFLSASERQSRELMQKTQQHCRALQIAIRHYHSHWLDGTAFKQLEIELPNGVRVIGLPANPETVRGFTGDVFLDEFAMHNDDREIWAGGQPLGRGVPDASARRRRAGRGFHSTWAGGSKSMFKERRRRCHGFPLALWSHK